MNLAEMLKVAHATLAEQLPGRTPLQNTLAMYVINLAREAEQLRKTQLDLRAAHAELAALKGTAVLLFCAREELAAIAASAPGANPARLRELTAIA